MGNSHHQIHRIHWIRQRQMQTEQEKAVENLQKYQYPPSILHKPQAAVLAWDLLKLIPSYHPLFFQVLYKYPLT